MPQHQPEPAPIRGVCSIFYAFDVGLSIDLADVRARLAASDRPGAARHYRRGSVNFGYHTPPLRVREPAPPVRIGRFQTAPGVECALFDFGAISVAYSLPFEGPIGSLLELSDLLYENASLLADSRERVETLLRVVRSAVKKWAISAFVEGYVLYQIESWPPQPAPAAIPPAPGPAPAPDPTPDSALSAIMRHAPLIAGVLRGENRALSTQEIEDAVGHRIAFAPDDATLIDWNASILVGSEMEDVRSVLEYANVELLEMRYLDDRLDRALDQSYLIPIESRARRLLSGGSAAELRALAELQADSALLFEGVNNALKLVGDQYLARVYRLISQRLHLPEWDASILRKLATLESIYQKRNDFQTTRRLETLEWIVIVLITVEILLSIISHL